MVQQTLANLPRLCSGSSDVERQHSFWGTLNFPEGGMDKGNISSGIYQIRDCVRSLSLQLNFSPICPHPRLSDALDSESSRLLSLLSGSGLTVAGHQRWGNGPQWPSFATVVKPSPPTEPSYCTWLIITGNVCV